MWLIKKKHLPYLANHIWEGSLFLDMTHSKNTPSSKSPIHPSDLPISLMGTELWFIKVASRQPFSLSAYLFHKRKREQGDSQWFQSYEWYMLDYSPALYLALLYKHKTPAKYTDFFPGFVRCDSSAWHVLFCFLFFKWLHLLWPMNVWGNKKCLVCLFVLQFNVTTNENKQ